MKNTGSIPGQITDATDQAGPSRPWHLYLALLVNVLVVPVLALAVLYFETPKVERAALATIRTIGQLKVDQVKHWLKEHHNYANMLMANGELKNDFEQWLGARDPAARARIDNQVRALRLAAGNTVSLLDLSQAPAERNQALAWLLARAQDSGHPQFGSLYRDPNGTITLDLVIAMTSPSPLLGSPKGGLVISTQIGDSLFPLLLAWPTPSASAESLLVRQVGEEVLYLSPLRHLNNVALNLRLPLASPDLPAAIALRDDEAKHGLTGRDYRHVAVLAATLPVPGSDWHLVTKIDRNEVLQPLHTLVAWVSAAALLAIAVIGAFLLRIWRQQQRNYRLELLARTGEQARLLAQFYNLPFMGMAVLKPDGSQWRQVNDRLCEILGYSREELIATRTMAQLIHPDDLPAILSEHKRLVDGEIDGFQREVRLVRKDGRLIDVALSAKAVRTPDGQVEHIVKTLRDITSRKRLEEIALRNQEQLNRFIEQAPISIAMLDRNMNYLAYSHRWLKDYGRGYSDLKGLNHYDVHPDISAEWKAVHRQCLAGASRQSDSDYWRQADGSEHWMSWAIVPWRNELNEISGIIISSDDVTASKRAERQLREREEELKRAQAVGQIGSWRLDVRHNELTWSEENHRIFGVPQGSPMSYEFFLERVHPDDRARVDNGWQAALKGEPYDIEHRLLVDGEEKWVRERAELAFDADGQLIGGLGTTQDITKQKRSEEALLEANRHKDQFLAMLAHELRNPLTPIGMAAGILMESEPDEANVHWAATTISNQVKHITQLVDDLLDVSRISRGRIDLKLDTVALAELVALAVESVRPAMAAKGQRFSQRLPVEAVYLNGDKVRLTQVLVNLLDNAAKYTQEGGAIELSAEIADREVGIRVKDNGCGMTADLLPYVFELFRQGNRSLDRSQGGLGIGLSLAERLVALHGGRIDVTSPGPGAGSTFTVWLPRLEPLPQALAATPGPQHSAQPGLKVLVVDDDRLIAFSLGKMLKLKGYTVATVSSGAEALEQVDSFAPEAILLDIGLAGMDGFETARRLRALPGGERYRLIALSGYGDQAAQDQGREAGFDAYLVKPVNFDLLATELNQARG